MEKSLIKPASSFISYHGVSLHHQTIIWVLLWMVAASIFERVARRVISGLLIELLSFVRAISEMLTGILARVDDSRSNAFRPPTPTISTGSVPESTTTPAPSNGSPRDLARPTPPSSIRDWVNSPEDFYVPGGHETIKTIDGYRRKHYKQKPGAYSALQAAT
ncbi:hypothetical protein PG991_016033 [Apiospora marii]|uniref:Uncharacterized protein n=1 Tax=Apiospora marii TaxID=335849 RepID=A0ABR1R0F7_9PEZI